MEHIAIDADDIQGMIDMLKANGATILEEAVVSGDRRVVFFEGPDGVHWSSLRRSKSESGFTGLKDFQDWNWLIL